MTKEHKKVVRVEKTYWDMTHEEKYAYVTGMLEGFSPNEEVRSRAQQALSKDADPQSMSDPEARSFRRHWWQLGTVVVVLVASIVFSIRLASNPSSSAFDVARNLQAAGIICTPGELVTNSSGAVREGLPCTAGDLMYEITTYPTDQATNEVTRMVEDGVGCKLAVSRSSKVFTLLVGDKFSIFVASTLPTGIAELTNTRRVFQDDCQAGAI
jgi:uncharacterized UPF0146 family protein